MPSSEWVCSGEMHGFEQGGRDPAVAGGAVRQLEPFHGRVVDVDSDPSRHADLPAVDENVEVGVHVQEDELVRLGSQAGLAGQGHRVRRRGPRRGAGRGGERS